MGTIVEQAPDSQTATHPSYLRLSALWPPHPIRDDADYDAAVNVIYPLSGKAELGQPLDAGETMYIEVVVMLIGAYDDEHHSFPMTDLPLSERLDWMMEQHDLNQSQIAEIAGISRGNMSDVMAGRRELSKKSIKRLAKRFKESADYFM